MRSTGAFSGRSMSLFPRLLDKSESTRLTSYPIGFVNAISITAVCGTFQCFFVYFYALFHARGECGGAEGEIQKP
jgi:hypothetical protein